MGSDRSRPELPSASRLRRRRRADDQDGEDLAAGSPGVAAILGRQRTAGNAAVVASLAAVQRSPVVQRVGGTVSADTFNQARTILADAGSDKARKTHPKHGGKEAPRNHAQALVDEAQDDEVRLRGEGRIEQADRIRAAVRRVKAMFGFYGS